MSEIQEDQETQEISLVNEKDAEDNFYFKYFFLREIFTYGFSTDHKIISKQYLFTGIFWALVGSILSLLFRLQLGFPDMDLSWLKPLLGNWIRNGRLDPEFYLALITMHGTIMMFFVLTASFSGTFSNFLIPLQIGTRDMASGFINMLSYWFFFISSFLMFYSLFLVTGPASGGWTFYPPLSALEKASAGSGEGMSWWLVSMIFFVISTLLASINYIVTVINFRTVGMYFSRLPLTIWAQLLTAILSLFSFPVLFAAILLLILDRSFGTSFYLSEIYIGGEHLQRLGGSPVLFQHLFWFLGHPEVYIAILPAFGITSEVISTNSRKPIFGYAAMVLSMMLITSLSIMVWAHHMFVSGMNPFLGYMFSLTSFIIAVPSAVKVFNWLTTIWGGSVRFPPAMLFALGMVSLFITGGLTGIFLANSPIDIQVHDTYFVVAHFHLVMGSAAFFGFFAGLYHWFPKMFGRMMSERLGSLHFWFTFAGVYLIFFPMHFMGLSGLPRRYYSFTVFESFHGFADLNVFITVASVITFGAQLIFIFNFFYSMFYGKRAVENPWRSNTLEWTTPVMLRHGNWPGKLPVVYRWPYDYSKPGASTDFIPQNISEEEEKNRQQKK
jgi:cytochrome c oxidase subunit I